MLWTFPLRMYTLVAEMYSIVFQVIEFFALTHTLHVTRGMVMTSFVLIGPWK